MDTPSAFAEKNAEWESYVGKAILRFGDIEIVSIYLLAKAFPEKSLNSLCRKRFADRAERLIELLESRKPLSKPERKLLSGFREAASLAPTRNLIAHNPLMLDIYVNRDETGMHAEHSISSLRTEKGVLDLAALKEFADKVDNLSADIWLNYCQAVESSNDLWRLINGEGCPQ